MFVELMKSKIHRVKVTEADLNYVGSIGIDESLMLAADLLENEKVHVLNVNNGERFETYVIKMPKGSGAITVNGAAARKVHVGDILLVVAYGMMTREEAATFKPIVIFPDETTNLLKA
jgi:aspartate 1-decarboxylase